jgi:hypothetical protein
VNRDCPQRRRQKPTDPGRAVDADKNGQRRFLVLLRRGVLVLTLLSALMPFLNSAQTQPDEYQVKAAFILHFVQLVEWPAESLGAGNRPVVLCTTGKDPAASRALESIVRGKQIGTHPVQTRYLQESDDFRACHVLFMVGKEDKRLASILVSLKNAPVLTIGEWEDFVPNHGMIGFFIQENRVRFDIDLNAAQRANLMIDSRLLLLANRVISDGKKG